MGRGGEDGDKDPNRLFVERTMVLYQSFGVGYMFKPNILVLIRIVQSKFDQNLGNKDSRDPARCAFRGPETTAQNERSKEIK